MFATMKIDDKTKIENFYHESAFGIYIFTILPSPLNKFQKYWNAEKSFTVVLVLSKKHSKAH